jgi:hypothetical protein
MDMTTKVTIENYGTFYIDSSKVSELISWLQNNWSQPSLSEITQNIPTGNQLINE